MFQPPLGSSICRVSAREPPEPSQLGDEAGEAGVQPARVREHEDAGPLNLVRLQSRTWVAASRPAEESPVESHTDESDELGTYAADLPLQHAPAGFELGSLELRGRARGARAEVRDRHPEIQTRAGGYTKGRKLGYLTYDPPEAPAARGGSTEVVGRGGHVPGRAEALRRLGVHPPAVQGRRQKGRPDTPPQAA